MATFQVVAAVTAALHDLLSNEVAGRIAGATVKVEPPRDTRNDAQAAEPAVHLYLYRVTENAAWRNEDLPRLGRNGQLRQRPRLPLTLHYLLTFYGEESQYVPQQLLGAVAGLLQQRPVLSGSILERMMGAGDTLDTLLRASKLADEVERIKFSMTTLDIEEISKLWSVLLQVPYALSLTYEASVVFVEPEEEAVPARPVLDRRLAAAPRSPVAVAAKPRIVDVALDGEALALAISPPLRPDQSATLLLTADWRQSGGAPVQEALPWQPSGDETQVARPTWALGALPAGSYFVRLLVDGLVSDLEIGRDGTLQGPRVTIGGAP